jgi:hypothetical protein
MLPSRKVGRAVAVSAAPLPELIFDLSEGGAPATPLGKTETPVNILAEFVFDLHAAEPAPALQLSLYLRSQATPGEVALDLFRFVVAVNQLDLSFRGTGLTPDDALCEAAPTGETMRIVLRPRGLEGAVDRLVRLAEAINGVTNPAVPMQRLNYRSIERWEAIVLPAAA